MSIITQVESSKASALFTVSTWCSASVQISVHNPVNSPVHESSSESGVELLQVPHPEGSLAYTYIN